MEQLLGNNVAMGRETLRVKLMPCIEKVNLIQVEDFAIKINTKAEYLL